MIFVGGFRWFVTLVNCDQDAMRAVQAEGIAMCDAHPDLEVFRLRLGVALNYEFSEKNLRLILFYSSHL